MPYNQVTHSSKSNRSQRSPKTSPNGSKSPLQQVSPRSQDMIMIKEKMDGI